MSENKQQAPDMVSKMMQWQQNFWQSWTEAAKKGMDAFAGGAEGGGPFKMYQEWIKSFQDAMGGKQGEGLGPDVFMKTLDASKMYGEVMRFWAGAMAPMMDLKPGQTLSAEKIKEMYDTWQVQYRELMRSMWGALPDEEFKDTAESFESAAKAGSDYVWTFLEPVLKNLEDLPHILERVAKGEPGATLEVSGLFKKNYESTVGRALRAPSLGYFRETTELMGKTVDAYNEFAASMAEYQTLFHNTGMKASERVFQKLLEFQGKEVTADTPRDFYHVWWTINEDTYHDLFLSPEFTGLLKEVLHRGLTFKKWFDELLDQVKELANIPTKKDMDEIYKALYDLRKEIRWQERAIRQFEEHLGVTVKRPAPVEE